MIKNLSKTGGLTSISFVICASIAYSINDLVFKLFSETYPLHQMVFVRSLVALLLCTAIIVPLSGGFKILRTQHPFLHLLRGLFIVASNIALYTGLAILPIANSTAIFYSAPLMITALSVIVLKEKVGWWRWLAIAVGLLGVLLIVRPGFSGFNWGVLLPIFAAFTYALLQIMTRWMGVTEPAATLFFYTQVMFLAFSTTAFIAIGDGEFANPDAPAIDFLLRAWVVPSPLELSLLILLGVLSASGGYMMTHAYRQSMSSLIAPFEYVALLFAIMWGALIWNTLPDLLAGYGIALIVIAGLTVAIREARLGLKFRKTMPRPDQ